MSAKFNTTGTSLYLEAVRLAEAEKLLREVAGNATPLTEPFWWSPLGTEWWQRLDTFLSGES